MGEGEYWGEINKNTPDRGGVFDRRFITTEKVRFVNGFMH